MLPLPAFEMALPESIEDVVRLIGSRSNARLIAGGTDIVPNLKHRLEEPELLVSLSAVADLKGIRVDDDGAIRIGAMTTLAEVRDHPVINAQLGVLAEAAGHIASPQIQNMGTIGGNLCLDTRCVYYNQSFFWRQALGYCLKKDGTECHVVPGGQNCVAASSADTAPAFMTLGATVRIVGPTGERTIPVSALYKTPGDDYLTLQSNELVVEVIVPPQATTLSGYQKLRIRKSIDFPIFSLAAVVELAPDGLVCDLRLAATALGSKPKDVSKKALKLASQRQLDDGLIAELGALVRKRCVPLANINVDSEWRRAMIPVVTKQLLERLRARALGS